MTVDTTQDTTQDTTGTTVDARRFRVRADAFFVRHSDGVWLRNNTGSFSISGSSAYELIDSLLSQLNGDRMLEEIVGGLPDGARKSVLRLVDLLERNGFIKPVDHPAEVVPAWMRDRYGAQLAFLDHHADRPVARMTRVRSRFVVCVGEGVALRSLLSAVSEFGMAKVLVVTSTAAIEDITEVISEARRRDPQLRWRTLLAGTSLDLNDVAALPEVTEAEHVLLAFDRDEAEVHDQVTSFQRSLGARGSAVGVLGRCGDFVVSALGLREVGWCWRCLHRCIAAPVVGDASDLQPAAAPAAIAGLRVVQHAFCSLAGVELDDPRTVTTVEPLAPIVRTHRARRHPLCSGHQTTSPVPITNPAALPTERIRPNVPASQDPPDLVAIYDRIVEVTGAWTDRISGPLLELGEGDVDQLPLSGSRCVVADPLSNASSPITRALLCRALSPREARNQVVLFALEWLAERIAASGGPVPAGAYGAGWTPAEAWYRAQVAASLALSASADRSGWMLVAEPELTDSPARRFLVGALASADRPWQAKSIERLPTGMVGASVRIAAGDIADGDPAYGDTAHGVGVDEHHAVNNALLSAVCATAPDARCALPAHLAPPTDTWANAVALIIRRSGRAGSAGTTGSTGSTGSASSAVEVSASLGFLDGGAFVVAVTLPGTNS